jgi:hypothetical protein
MMTPMPHRKIFLPEIPVPCVISLPSPDDAPDDASDDACVEECLRGCVVRSVDSVYEGRYSMKVDEKR